MLIRALAPLDLGEVTSITAMTGGTSLTFRIDLARGDAVVLKAYEGSNATVPRKDAYAASLLAELDLPVTRFLLVDDSRNTLPFGFAVTNYLPGATVGSFRNHPDSASLYRQMGSLLRRLHTIRMPAYGAFGESGIVAPVPTNTTYMRNQIAHTVTRFGEMGASSALTERLRAKLEDGLENVVGLSTSAVFAHDDFHPNNLLAIEDASGRLKLSGLIDFGNARAADAVSDLAKCLFCTEHDAPGSTIHILEGYGPAEHPDPDAAIQYYLLFHRMVMWWWLRQIGVIADADAQSDIMDSLRAVIGSS